MGSGAPVDVLTVPEFARAVRIHEETVRRMIRRGEIPAVRIGRTVRIRADVLESYLAGGVPRSLPPNGDTRTPQAVPERRQRLSGAEARKRRTSGPYRVQ
jgi:excisionase family DNA binding protein